MLETIVIGGGLFGSMVADGLRRLDREVTTVYRTRQGHGSGPAACLIKPSWVSGLGKAVVNPAMEMLHNLYEVHDIRFKTGPLHTTVHWVDPDIIMDTPPDVPMTVTRVEQLADRAVVTLDNDRTLEAEHVIIAAGVWSNDIVSDALKIPGLSGRAGTSYLYRGQIEQPFIHPWAPYKQLVAFNISPEHVWIGDGTSIMPKNWTQEREAESFHRCRRALEGLVDTDQRPIRQYGIRPYVPKAKPCWLHRVGRITVINGGAKNGTLAAAWCTHQILHG